MVYNRGSIKIKVIRGEMEVGEIGRRGVAAVGPSVRTFVRDVLPCLPQKLVNFELIICLARGVHAERFNMRTIITLPNSYVSHGEHILLMIKLRERVFLIFRQPPYPRRRRSNIRKTGSHNPAALLFLDQFSVPRPYSTDPFVPLLISHPDAGRAGGRPITLGQVQTR